MSTGFGKNTEKGGFGMKKLLSSPIFKNVLVGCMLFTTWISSTQASIFFFGEYEYPNEKDYLA